MRLALETMRAVTTRRATAEIQTQGLFFMSLEWRGLTAKDAKSQGNTGNTHHDDTTDTTKCKRTLIVMPIYAIAH